MTPSTVPDTSAGPAADIASPTNSGPSSIGALPPLDSPADASTDETAPLRAAVHALTMHATIHAGIAVEGVPVGVEEQDIVYRSQPEGSPRPQTAVAASDAAPSPPDWRLTLPTDPVLLFRFSALTYNGHRIHYDAPYATGVEGYPGLVVHGPLLALLALELPRTQTPTETVTGFAYRLLRPAFAGAVIEATARRHGAHLDLAVGAVQAGPSLTATATLAPPRPAKEHP